MQKKENMIELILTKLQGLIKMTFHVKSGGKYSSTIQNVSEFTHP